MQDSDAERAVVALEVIADRLVQICELLRPISKLAEADYQNNYGCVDDDEDAFVSPSSGITFVNG